MSGWLAALRVYFTPRMAAVFVLGMVSGLPLALTGGTLSALLKDSGVDLKAIGLFAAVALPYTFKFLWAPLIDRMPLPVLTRLLGRRRAWMLVLGAGLMVCLAGLGFSDPVAHPFVTALWALAVATLSASHDIVIDATRVELLGEQEQAAGATTAVFGYRIGMLLSGAGALFLADTAGWKLTYLLMAAIVPVAFLTMLMAGETGGELAPADRSRPLPERVAHWMRQAVVDPFLEFSRRDGWWLILAFIATYKLADSFAGVMTTPFLLDIGFTKTDIAVIVKSYGLAATLIGAFLGGILVPRLGMVRALWVCGILQMLGVLPFVWQARAGADSLVLTVAITAENLTSGMGTTALVGYLASQCRREFTATQYALLSALASSGRTLLSTPTGWVAEHFGWETFFLVATFAGLPGMALLWLLARRLRASGLPAAAT